MQPPAPPPAPQPISAVERLDFLLQPQHCWVPPQRQPTAQQSQPPSMFQRSLSRRCGGGLDKEHNSSEELSLEASITTGKGAFNAISLGFCASGF
eukprot:1157610-Pelagomonas_calceolata.AAC.2